MKKYFILSVLLLVSGFFASCNYLNIDDYFEDTFQEDSIYANKRNIERYFNGAAALLPVVDKIWNENTEYKEINKGKDDRKRPSKLLRKL